MISSYPKKPHTAKRYFGQGPPQAWQIYPSDNAGDRSPTRRLYLMGRKGLPVGPGTRWLGGISDLTAYRMWCDGLVDVVMNGEKTITHVYPRQLCFNFY